MLLERRSVPRRIVQVIGKIYSSGSPIIPCVVLNISERGAQLQFEKATPLCDNLLLIIEEFGRVHSGAIRWRQGTKVGMEFRRDPDDLLA